MKIAWSLRSFHAIFTPIRYAARAAQVKHMLYPPFGVGERWPIERGEAKPIIRLAAEKKKLHMMFIITETRIASETMNSQ